MEQIWSAQRDFCALYITKFKSFPVDSKDDSEKRLNGFENFPSENHWNFTPSCLPVILMSGLHKRLDSHKTSIFKQI